QRVSLSDLELNRLEILGLDKSIEIENKLLKEHRKYIDRIIDINLKKFYESGKPKDLQRYFEFEVFNEFK
ncbi:MAG: hypothetical protein WAT79_02225, partial [Saprospiraceae bacterium]